MRILFAIFTIFSQSVRALDKILVHYDLWYRKTQIKKKSHGRINKNYRNLGMMNEDISS